MSGFVASPGTDFGYGDEPEIAKRLDQLGRKLGLTIFGISGHRTPAHSIAVGGFPNDPHTAGKAADIGVNGQTRASAAQLTDAQLASVGLYRPFPGAAEVNHVQLKAGSKPVGGGGVSIGGALGTVGQLVPGVGPIVSTIDATGNIAGNAVSDATTAAAKASAKALVGLVVDALGVNGARVLLSIALVLAAVALIALGGARALGLRTPPIPIPALAAARAAAGAK